MAYPEHLKQRAIELSNGRSAGGVLRELEREFPNDLLPDERTIRRWRRDRQAAHTGRVQVSIRSSISENWREHNEQLAAVANSLLASDLDSVSRGWSTHRVAGQESYILTRKKKVGDYYQLTNKQLSERLKQNIVHAEHKYERWFFNDCFLPHLQSELPENMKTKGFYDIVKEEPYGLIEILRVLAKRKTFTSTCQVCEPCE